MDRTVFFFLMIFICSALCAQGQTVDKAFKPFFEKPYLHTDREQYAAGEDIWFKAYLVNAQTDQLFESSNNLYVELISPDAKVAERKLIRIDKGLGNGDFHLSDSIAPGMYRLRAFTNWMRNFGDSFVFEKSIEVAGSGTGTENRIAEALQANGQKPKNAAPEALPLQLNIASTSSISFFPEGGSLIEGVQSIVAVKTEIAAGKGISAKGTIKTLSGEEIAPFSTNAPGLGSVMFTPIAGAEYYAEGTYSNGKTFRKALPRALLKGFSLHASNGDSAMRVVVSTNAHTIADFKSKSFVILFKTKGKTYLSKSFVLNELQTIINFSKEGFPAGISSMALYGPDGKPYAERLIYHRAEEVSLQLSTDKPSYLPKGKVVFNIKASDRNNAPVKAMLSLSVTDAGIVSANRSNIVTWLDLQSELRGKIEDPEQYFNAGNPLRDAQMDLLLLTHGWRDFTWKRLADSALRISYLLEKGLTVQGYLRQVWLNRPIPNANITLTAWGAVGNKLFSTVTDSSGRFFLDGVNLYGNQELKIVSTDQKGKRTGLIRVDTATMMMYPVAKPGADTSLASPVFKAEVQKRMSLAKKYHLSDTISLKEVSIIKFRRGSTLSDTSYLIQKADYELKYLRNYLLEKVPGAVVCTAVPEHVVFYGLDEGMRMTRRHPFFSTEEPEAKRIWPQVYQKNLMEKDYLNIPLDQVVSVRMIHNRNRDGIVQGIDGSGRQVYDGVWGDYFDIFLKVKAGAFERQGYQAINLDIDGYYEARVFSGPKYESPSDKVDVRATIHWEPGITTNEKGEASVTWYNADPKNKIRIAVEGLTESGIPVTGTAVYEVR